MSKFHRLAGVVIALILSFAACSGDKDSGDADTKAVHFPDSVVKDELLVRVNSFPIFGKDLWIFTAMYMPGAEDSLRNRSFNAKMLDGMIDRVLLYLEADAIGVSVSDSTLQWFVQQFGAAMGGERALNQLMVKNDISQNDLELMIRRDLMIRTFLEQNVLSQTVIPDSLARSFYDQNPQDFIAPDSLHARHIIIRASQTDTPDDIENKKQTLRDLKGRIDAGEDFEELARQYSEGPSAPRGGDLGYFTGRDMVPAFSNVAFALEKGEVSDVVETQFGYHLIKCVDKKPSRKVSYEEIEQTLKMQLRQYSQAQTLQMHLQDSRNTAIIERNFSMD